MKKVHILWTDDEIDLLKPHILFLEEKGYAVDTANNGADAIEMVRNNSYDLIFLDENMPGLSGLETLPEIKEISPDVPVVMITKNEEEDIMDEAIGSKIDDYLIKPVNPKQILLSIKKNVDVKRLVSEKVVSDYQSAFGQLGMEISSARNFEDWVNVYQKLVKWQIDFESQLDTGMQEVLKMQLVDANREFSKFVEKNYKSWFEDAPDKPLLSPNIFKDRIIPLLDEGHKVFVFVIDNLRYDQYKVLSPFLSDYLSTESEEIYCSILPTATQYARNSIFAGLMPLEIDKLYPQYWLNDDEEGGKNQFEKELLEAQLKRLNRNCKYCYEKISQHKIGEKLVDNYQDLLNNDLNVLVYNYVDMLSHARTEIDMIRELANDEAAFRSLTISWFKHSPLFDLIKKLKGENVKVVITTDHGNVRITNPIKVVGDRSTTTNLRYKTGRNLNYNEKDVFSSKKPEELHLPKSNLTSTYIFAQENDYLVYPNKYNYFVNYYKNTFQHGGISLEEMLIPFVILNIND